MKLIFILFFISPWVQASESIKFQAESFLREGNADAALNFLEENNIDTTIALNIKGQAYYMKGDWKKSLYFFNKFTKNSKTQAVSTLIRFAQLYLKLNLPDKALAVLRKIKVDSMKKDLLWSQSLWNKGLKDKSVTYLESLNSKKYSDFDLIERQKAYYLFNLNRISKIFDISRKYLKGKSSSSEFGLYVVSLLKEKDRYIAEKYFDLLLSFKPEESLLLKERGLFEIEGKNLYIASIFLDKAAHLDDIHSFEAAAVHLDLKNHVRSLFFNSKVKDLKKKAVQKFTIYLDAEDFEKAFSMKYELEKHDLLKNNKISYALIYTSFKLKDYKYFHKILSKITAKKYLSKALKLKEIIDSCKSSVSLKCVFS